MNRLGTIFAKTGDTILLETGTKGPVVAYAGILERFDDGGRINESQWPAEVLEDEGGRAMVRKTAFGYNVIIIPELGAGASIDATLKVGKQPMRSETIKTSETHGWSIVVL